MHRFLVAFACAGLALGAAAQDALPDPSHDAARQERMNEAYRDHQAHPGTFERAEENVKRGARSAGHSIHTGLQHAGHAIGHGAHVTGQAIEHGAHATGRAIHHGVDKVTGKDTAKPG